MFFTKEGYFNHQDINLISFFNHSIICFILNVYLDNQQNALKYLKNTKVNLNNILIMTEDFNIRDSDWNPSYSHYLSYSDILREIADDLNLNLSTPINPVSTQYVDNSQNSNLVIDFMFLYTKSERFNNHWI